MKICCLGDSLTEGDYGVWGKSGIANVQSKNYPYFLEKMSGATVSNYGKCGFRATTYLKHYLSGAVELGDADIVIVMLGTNGGHAPDHDTADNRAYVELIERCQRDAPNAQVILCTPPHATRNPAMSNYGYAPRAEAAAAFVRALAKEKTLRLVDLATCPDFTDEAESVMQPNDGLHFSELGYRAMAEYIWNNISIARCKMKLQ